MPTLCACRYLHKLIKLLDMNITAFRPSHPVMENGRTWMVVTCRIMVILLIVIQDQETDNAICTVHALIDPSSLLNDKVCLFRTKYQVR